MFRAKNLSKKIGGRDILNNVSFDLHRRETTVLFGPSGSGKTTLCRNLTLLEHPDSGSIEIDGAKYFFPHNETHLPLFDKVNMVFQQLFLWPHLTNEENIKLAIGSFDSYKKEKFDYLVTLLDIKNIIKNSAASEPSFKTIRAVSDHLPSSHA